MDEPLVTRVALSRAMLRACVGASGLGVVVTGTVVGPNAPYVPPLVIAHAALVGLLAFPLAWVERAARRHARGLASQVGAALLAGTLALVGSSLAWTQARYTQAVLAQGTLEAGLAAIEERDVIARRPDLATALFVCPALGYGLAVLLALRGASIPRRAVAAPLVGAGAATAFLVTIGDSPAWTPSLVAYAALATTVLVGAGSISLGAEAADGARPGS